MKRSVNQDCEKDKDVENKEQETQQEEGDELLSEKRAKVVAYEAVEESCVVCMESADKECLQPHSCPQCKPDAWKICTQCNGSLLSRECPVCRGPYAPLHFHKFVDHLCETNNPEERIAIAALSVARFTIITYETVIVYSPQKNKLFFSLPQDASVDPKNIRYLRVSLNVPDASRLKDDVFVFTNSVWDELEANEEEHEVLNLRETIQWITQELSASSEVVMFSKMTTEDVKLLIEAQARNST